MTSPITDAEIDELERLAVKACEASSSGPDARISTARERLGRMAPEIISLLSSLRASRRAEQAARAYVANIAARPCATPGKDCGWCDSCEARLTLAGMDKTPCAHAFESNPGMTDSQYRYCTKCGIFEGAAPSASDAGAGRGRSEA